MMNLFKRVSRHIKWFTPWFVVFMADPLSAQLVANGSFENTELGQVIGNDIEGWSLLVGADVGMVPDFEIVDDPVRHGNRALKIGIHGIGPNSWSIQAVADSIPIEAGATYRYSIWAKSEQSGAQVNFTVGDYAYNEYGKIRPAILSADEWQEFSYDFTVTDQQTFARAPIHLSIASNIGNSLFIDNLRIIDVEQELDSRNPILIEAESGEIGNDFAVQEEGELTFIQIQTDGADFSPAIWEYPGSGSRVATYDVVFPSYDTYDLFAKIRVGPDEYDDDSFLYANGFGIKDTVDAEEWIVVNQLQSAGFSESDHVVHEPGGLGEGVWKWVNLSQNAYHETATTFTVEDNLTVTFQIGGRETGLDIDRIAFGRSDLYFTVGNLELGEPGSDELPGDDWEGPPLADGLSKFLGCAYSTPQAFEFEAYWNQVTPENAGKWASVERTRDVMNWGGLDAAYNFAKNNGFKFRFHVLIWGNQQPGWIETLSAEEQLEEIEEWFAAVAERYQEIDYLEVVNEPLHDPPDTPGNGGGNYIEALGGDNGLYGTGWDWVIKAFELARQYFPASTKLMLNDYNIVRSSSNTANYLEVIHLLKERGLIDGFGFQAHGGQVNSTPASQIRNNLNTLATAGLPIQVTEMDVDGPTDAVQLAEYQRVFPIFWEHPSVEGITLWGWRPVCYNPTGHLVLNDGTERPALPWLRTYLSSTPPPQPPVPISPHLVGGQPRDPILIWHSSVSATSYHLQVAATSVFTSVIEDTTVSDTLLHVDPLDANRRFFWRVRASNEHGTSDYSMTANFMTGEHFTAVEANRGIPTAFILSQNYPNPFNPSTEIHYSLPRKTQVTLDVFDIQGRHVHALVNEAQSPGRYTVTFDAGDFSSGIYYYRLTAGSFVDVKKMILLK